jgi:hypothetical protein
MTIAEADKVRARGHLGYGGVQQSATFLLGVPAAVQTAFMVEGTWARILPSHEARFRQLLDNMDGIEAQMLDDQGDYAAEQVGSIKVNLREFDMLIRQYRYWQGALANMLQIAPNPFDQRIGLGMGYNGGGGMNVSVMH